MTVIAMTREIGSLGKDVATGVAAALGLDVVHHELVEHHVAEKLKTSDALVHRYLDGDASFIERWRIDGAKLSRFTAEEVLEQAGRGNVVIRGWGRLHCCNAFRTLCVQWSARQWRCASSVR